MRGTMITKVKSLRPGVDTPINSIPNQIYSVNSQLKSYDSPVNFNKNEILTEESTFNNSSLLNKSKTVTECLKKLQFIFNKGGNLRYGLEIFYDNRTKSIYLEPSMDITYLKYIILKPGSYSITEYFKKLLNKSSKSFSQGSAINKLRVAKARVIKSIRKNRDDGLGLEIAKYFKASIATYRKNNKYIIEFVEHRVVKFYPEEINLNDIRKK
jgi:hypothetical protein